MFVDYIRIKMKAMCSLEEVIDICNMKLNTVDDSQDISEVKLKRITETIKIASDEAACIMYDHKYRIESKQEVKGGGGIARALFTEEELEEIKEKMMNDTRSIDEKIEDLDDDFSEFE